MGGFNILKVYPELLDIICLSEKLSTDEAYSLVKKFIETPFSTEERHHRRIEKIAKYEDSHEC